MGLDQYAKVVESSYDSSTKTVTTTKQEIAYWRKHNRLQGFMEKLYESKGGKGDFNCAEVEITAEDLDTLERVINSMNLPATGGFFFGTDSYENYEEWYKKDDVAFIKNARKAIKAGFTVIYTCWW